MVGSDRLTSEEYESNHRIRFMAGYLAYRRRSKLLKRNVRVR